MIVLLSFIQVLLLNIVLFLLLTAIIATITLMERKILSLIQRRVGPNYIGYKGRLQFIADAIKLLFKHILVLNTVNKLLFIIVPSIVVILCYLFWINLIWGPNLSICEIEYNLLFMGVLSLFFSFLIFFIGWVSKNKYAIISSTRVLVVTLNLEIFINFLIIFIILLYESFSFFQIVNLQNKITLTLFLLLPILPLCFIIFFLETSRIPFDLNEAESELIAGHTTEMGGFFFALFYLGEYFHLFCFSITYTLLFLGGWNI